MGVCKMVIEIVKGTTDVQVKNLVDKLTDMGKDVQHIKDGEKDLLGLIGNDVDVEVIRDERIVSDVRKINDPFKRVSREFKSEDTVVEIMGRKVGGGNIGVVAGPCAVESEHQILSIAQEVRNAGASMLRGGAFKPRTSPYSFQGMGEEGIELLVKAKEMTGLPIVTELISINDVELFDKYVDVIQIGARNMQNFDLLKAVGKLRKPVILKRGMSATIEEFLMAAEYILAGGNDQVILCERGIRTYEKATRNTLDLNAIPVLKRLTHLPVVVDPSHGTGHWWMVEAMTKAAIACGADGVIVEVHNDPENAMSDGPQSLLPKNFKKLMEAVERMAHVEGKVVTSVPKPMIQEVV